VGDRFRVVSANLLNGRADPERFAALIRSLEPDVVALQELGPAQADALSRVMPFARLAPARDHTGMGFALRQATDVRRLPLPHRDAWIAEVRPAGASFEGDAVEVINVHITAPHVQPAWRTLARRRGQLARLEAYLDATPRRRRVIVGDLNATPAWPVYQRLAARLRDAALEAALRDGGAPPRTWGPWPGAPRLLRIDHVFVSGLTTLDARVLPVEGSDHSAVLVDLAGEPA